MLAVFRVHRNMLCISCLAFPALDHEMHVHVAVDSAVSKSVSKVNFKKSKPRQAQHRNHQSINPSTSLNFQPIKSQSLPTPTHQQVAEFALGCQTYEGGFGGEPGAEAHGG